MRQRAGTCKTSLLASGIEYAGTREAFGMRML